MFKKLQSNYFEKRLERALRKRDRSGMNNAIKTIGILYNGDKIKEVAFFKALISSLKISEENVTYLALVTFDKKQPSLLKHSFSKKDFSWFGNLKSSLTKEFVRKNFDMLISYYDTADEYLDLITAQSNASFKVGLAKADERLFDLMLAVRPNEKADFNAEILKYLKILRKL